MTGSELVVRLKGLEPYLRSAGMETLYLFGSRARGDHRQDSDVDLLFQARRSDFSYYDLFQLKDDLSAALQLPVDLVEERALHPLLRSKVELDLVRVY